MKPVVFLGNSVEKVRAFPEGARSEIGFQIERVQRGLDPEDWKSMPVVGAGVREIRVREETGAFRAIYLASRADAVYVLHAFQKKSQRTNRLDIELARVRYRNLMRSG